MRRVFRWVDSAWYWLKCHILPSYRFHKIDIRKPGPRIGYTFGFLDQSERILYAAFVCLRTFVEKELGGRYPSLPIESDSIYEQTKFKYDTVFELYHWWMVERPEEEARLSGLLKGVKFPRPELSVDGLMVWKPERNPAMVAWRAGSLALEAKDQESLERLIKIRGFLWT